MGLLTKSGVYNFWHWTRAQGDLFMRLFRPSNLGCTKKVKNCIMVGGRKTFSWILVWRGYDTLKLQCVLCIYVYTPSIYSNVLLSPFHNFFQVYQCTYSKENGEELWNGLWVVYLKVVVRVRIRYVVLVWVRVSGLILILK